MNYGEIVTPPHRSKEHGAGNPSPKVACAVLLPDGRRLTFCIDRRGERRYPRGMARPLRIENRRIEMAHIASGSGLYFTLCPFLYPSPFASKYKLTPFARNSAKYKPDPVRSGSNGHQAPFGRGGVRTQRLCKDRRDNVGKGHPPAGARSNLQGLPNEGHRSRQEEFGLAHEPVGAMKVG